MNTAIETLTFEEYKTQFKKVPRDEWENHKELADQLDTDGLGYYDGILDKSFTHFYLRDYTFFVGVESEQFGVLIDRSEYTGSFNEIVERILDFEISENRLQVPGFIPFTGYYTPETSRKYRGEIQKATGIEFNDSSCPRDLVDSIDHDELDIKILLPNSEERDISEEKFNFFSIHFFNDFSDYLDFESMDQLLAFLKVYIANPGGVKRFFQLKDAMVELNNSAAQITKLWYELRDHFPEKMNGNEFYTDFPFALSMDEQAAEISVWVETAQNEIDDMLNGLKV